MATECGAGELRTGVITGSQRETGTNRGKIEE